MKTFDLPAGTRLKLTKTTPRKEHHGDELKQAISLRLTWETTNENLAALHPGLKDALYWRPPALGAQQTAEGIPETAPCLRVPTLAMPLKVDLSFSGYTITIDHGIDETSALELYVCELSKFTADALEGGTVSIAWSLASSKEITPELVGALCALEGGEIVARLTPPAMHTGPVIDATREALEAENPSRDLFAGPDDGMPDADDQHAGDFGRADDDSAGPGAGSSDDAGSDSEGGETDSGGDAAAFEAGAAAAIEKAAGRRGRNTRAAQRPS